MSAEICLRKFSLFVGRVYVLVTIIRLMMFKISLSRRGDLKRDKKGKFSNYTRIKQHEAEENEKLESLRTMKNRDQ